MKKFLRIIIVMIVILLIVLFFWQTNQPPETVKMMLEDNKESYDWVANFYYQDFMQSNEECLSYSFIEEDRIVNYKIMSEPRYIYLEKSQIEIFEKVDNSYYVDSKVLDRVYVYDNFVAFCNENGRASIVYSVDGRVPSWIDCPKEENEEIKTIQITENWYYVLLR